MTNLKCLDCGNTKLFNVGVKEYHRHLVDTNGDFVSDLGSDDSDNGNDWCCHECDSFNVELSWVKEEAHERKEV